MTDSDRDAYLAAFDAAKKRVERDGRKICHVIWRDGLLSFTSAAPIVVNGETVEFAQAVEPDPQGSLL